MQPEIRPVGIDYDPKQHLWKKRVTWFLLGGTAVVLFQAMKAWFYAHY